MFVKQEKLVQKNRVKKAGFVLLLCMFVFGLCSCTKGQNIPSKDADITKSDKMPPLQVLCPDEISFYERTDGFYLFLPGCTDINKVQFTYTGEKQFYDQETGHTYEKGEKFSMYVVPGINTVYERDNEKNEIIPYSFVVMQGDADAAMFITLENGNEGLLSINSAKWNEEKGNVKVLEYGGNVLYDGEMTKMKGHGLTSFVQAGITDVKNSYNINLGTKAELIEGAGKSKKWVLLKIREGGDYDLTGLSYMTAFYTYNALVKSNADRYNMCARYVDVYINNEYRGVYILTERMDENGAIKVVNLDDTIEVTNEKVNSVNLLSDKAIAEGIKQYSYYKTAKSSAEDLTGGYVLEVMCGHYGDGAGFLTKNGVFFSIKSPEHATKEQVQYIAKYVQEFENALYSQTGYNEHGKHWTEYADEESFAAQTLVYAYYLNWEIYRTSTYIYKDTDSSTHPQLTFGPAWDFETGAVKYNKTQTLFDTQFAYDVKQQYTWFEQAWQKGDFVMLLSKMNEEMKEIHEEMMSDKHGEKIFSVSELASCIEDSQNMNWVRWQQNRTYKEHKDDYLNALSLRYDNWYGNLWNPDKYLLGMYAFYDEESGKATSRVIGRTTGDVEWYRVSDNGQSVEKIGKGTDISIKEAGRYCAAVKGKNNAYYEKALGEVFANPEITMYSNVIEIKKSEGKFVEVESKSAYISKYDEKKKIIKGKSVFEESKKRFDDDMIRKARSELKNAFPDRKFEDVLRINAAAETIVPAGVTAGKLTGNVIGDKYGYANNKDTGSKKAFDGDTMTYFDPVASCDPGSYCGLDLTEKFILTKVRVYPRNGFTRRYDGATIQGSNDGIEWTTLFTRVGEAMAQDWQEITSFSNNSGYRYYRYYNPRQHGDVAELEFYGFAVNEEEKNENNAKESSKITVTFYTGTNEGIDGIVLNRGDSYPQLPVPKKEGFTFNGWYTRAVGGNKAEKGDTCTWLNDFTLYAHWTK